MNRFWYLNYSWLHRSYMSPEAGLVENNCPRGQDFLQILYRQDIYVFMVLSNRIRRVKFKKCHNYRKLNTKGYRILLNSFQISPKQIICNIIQPLNTETNSWVKRDQLDATCFIITLFSAQHVSDANTSILRSLRWIRWVTSWVVSGSMCVGVSLQCGYGAT